MHLFERTLTRAFNAAHLLTASILQAEAAVLKAIDRFDPSRDTDETLFGYALRSAVQSQPGHQPESTGQPLPKELQAVLNLARELRYCFVLRVLIGMSKQACAQLLGVNVQKVDECTCTAMRLLAGVA
jgi:hypothetical protein